MPEYRLLSTLLKWLLSVGLLHAVLIGWPAMARGDNGDSKPDPRMRQPEQSRPHRGA